MLIARPGPVDQAGDVAVEADVAQAAGAGSEFVGVFLVHVHQGGDVLVAEHRVVVEVELGVEGEDLPLVGHDQGVDLGERGVGLQEELDERLQELLAVLGGFAFQAERLADLAGLEVGQADAHVDRLAVDLLGGLVGDDLDVDPPSVVAIRTGHCNSRSTARPR